MMADLRAIIEQSLSQIPIQHSIFVGLSGGLDSVVLTHLLAKQALQSGHTLTALHVNHGLSSEADQWEDFTRIFADSLGISWQSEQCRLGHVPANVEEKAREARYQFFSHTLAEDDVLFLAHHQNDQAETFLYRLMRGAGVRGLAAMMSIKRKHNFWVHRPLLNIPKDVLHGYATQHKLSWVEDSSNENTHFDRNFIRHKLLEQFGQRWPDVHQRLADRAEYFAHTAEAIEYLIDSAGLSVTPGAPLPISALTAHPRSVAFLLLRQWLPNTLGAIHLVHIWNDVIHAKAGADPVFAVGDQVVRRFQDHIYLVDECNHLPESLYQPWDGKHSIMLPGQSDPIDIDSLLDLGALPSEIDWSKVYWRFRRAGDRCRPSGRRHHQCLKVLFQEHGVPPWCRAHAPILCEGDRILAVYPYWVCY